MASTDEIKARLTETYLTGTNRTAIIGFLEELARQEDGVLFSDMLTRQGLPGSRVEDMTLNRLGLIVWREGQGFVVTDQGRALILEG